MPPLSTAQTEVTEVKQITTPRGARLYEVTRSRFTADGVVTDPPLRLMSVTTCIKRVGLAQDRLINWAKRYTAERAVEMAEEILSLKQKGMSDVAVDGLKRQPDRKRDLAAEVGTAVHKVIERFGQAASADEVALVVEATPDDLRPYLRQFLDFVEVVGPRFLHQECGVWSVRWAYAGQLDAILEVDGVRGVMDIKTGSGVYPEAALQIAAYRHAEQLIPRGSTTPIPMADLELTTGWVLKLDPDSWRFIEVDCGETVHKVFLNARTIAQRWVYAMEKTVLGDTREGAAPPK